MAKDKSKKASGKGSKKKWIFLGVLLVCLAAAGGGYVWMGLSYEGRMQKQTFVNGMDFSEKTPADVEAYYRGVQEEAQITLKKKDGTEEVLPLKGADYQIHVDTSSIDTGKLASMKWIRSYFEPTEYVLPLSFSYNESALKKEIHGMDCVSGKDVVEPKDAYLDHRKDGLYEVVPEVEGNTLDEEKVLAVVSAALSAGLQEADIADCYIAPKITKDDKELNRLAEQYNSIGGEEITINFVDAEETITTEEIVENIKFSDSGEVLVSDAWLAAKMEEFAEKYNTFQTRREFTTHDGRNIEVGGTRYDTYGFRLDQDDTRLALQTAIKQKESATINAVWNIPGIRRAKDDIKDDLGGTYVEVSIDDQHMWYYVAGELRFESDVVTGNTSKGRETPKGLCRVWAKQRDRYLVGQGYNSHVNYWMAFNWEGCGFHDATWRSNFGGNIYKGNGSHGCVNMPYSKAQEFYGMVGYDTPVVIY